MIIVDDALDRFEEYADHLRSVEYATVVNPTDGVGYPNIATELPAGLEEDILALIKAKFPFQDIKINILFARLSPEGVTVPHFAHTDVIMGHYSFMYYINPGEGGTAFLEHTTGMRSAPQNEEEMSLLEQDTNDTTKWEVIDMCQIKPNRACIFEADQIHGAMPFGGFGHNAEDGRLVVTAFFEVN